MTPDNIDSQQKLLKDSIQEGITDLRTSKVKDGNIVIDRLRKRIITQGNEETPSEADK